MTISSGSVYALCRALRAIIEEITNGDFFKDGDAYRPPDLLEDISRKRAGPTEAEKASGDGSLAKFGVAAIATKDFSATDGEDELPLYEGEEVIVVHAVPSNVWWRVKNGACASRHSWRFGISRANPCLR